MPTDPIYRDSAMALEAMPGSESVSWLSTLLDIKLLPETAERP